MNPFVFVLFGATGDLARNKLFPAIFSLYKNGNLGEKFYIVGFARREMTDEEFRTYVEGELYATDDPAWHEFAKNLYYQQGFFDEEEGYNNLIKKLNLFDDEIGACITRLFYLATPPDNYKTILNFLNTTKLSEGCGQGSSKWTRLAIEKPFGKDLETAKALDLQLTEIFDEKQIFRVDHYLAKETVQNMIVFRFANGIFEPVWNKEYIDHVQITWFEKKGVGSRGKFFDGVGILRDVAQNHLMQLVATVAMEQPKSFSKDDIRNERVKVIQSIRNFQQKDIKKNVIRGQYKGYTQEKNVSLHSTTDTFVAMKLFVDTKRFEDVPFYIRAGKKMPRDAVEIKIVFRQTCHLLFKEVGCPEEGNVLTIRIQPNEGIALKVIAKKPGQTMSLGDVEMKFSYKDSFGSSGIDAYEKLLLDILSGDQMLFNRSDELESSWEYITNILNSWKKEETIDKYEDLSEGPRSAHEIIETDGRKWLE